ncbi:MAG: hypothetical protein U0M06_04190 [Clostridia bacterium]|nr:hypothetical protein [Clostridia bacterium]
MSAKFYGTEKVGETFEYEGKTYEVIDGSWEYDVCMKCAFYTDNGCGEMACSSYLRTDKKSVYYRQRDNEINVAPEKADAKR